MNEYEFWSELGTIFDAVRSYQRKTIEFNKRFISPWLQLGNVFGQRESLTETIAGLRQATEVDSGNAQNWAALGHALCKAGSFADAMDAFKAANGLTPSDGSSVCNMAAALAAQGKYAEAIPLFRQSLELLTQPKDRATALNQLGDAYRRINDYENALIAFHEADSLDADDGLVPEDTGTPLGLPDQAASTVAALDEPSLIDSDPAQTMTPESEIGGGISAGAGAPVDIQIETSAAVAQIASSAEVDSAAFDSAPVAANLESEKTDVEEIAAVVASELAIPDHPALVDTTGTEAPPALPPASVSVADVEAQTPPTASPSPLKVEDSEAGDIAEGRDESHEIDGQEIEAPAGTGSAYDEYLLDLVEPQILSGETRVIYAPPSAEGLAEIAADGAEQVDADAKDAHIWNELAGVYLNSDRLDDAITACTKAIQMDSGFGWAYSNLALAHMHKGQNADAIVYFQRSIELLNDDKDKAVSWNRLGNLYRRQADYDQAVAAYQMADELDPQSTPISLHSRLSLLGSMPEPAGALIS